MSVDRRCRRCGVVGSGAASRRPVVGLLSSRSLGLLFVVLHVVLFAVLHVVLRFLLRKLVSRLATWPGPAAFVWPLQVVLGRLWLLLPVV